jgi:hypothetical protein
MRRRLWIPGFTGIVGLCGSIAGSVVAGLPWYLSLAVVLGITLGLFCLGLAWRPLRELVVRAAATEKSAKEGYALAKEAADGCRNLTEKLDGVATHLDELEISLKIFGMISHVLAWKSEIKFISRQRETVLDADGAGNDKTVITQVMTRRRPGPPIDMFPVMLSTDRKDVSFAELKYKIEAPGVGELVDHERLLINDRLVRYIIYNRLLTPIVYEGQPVQFVHSTCANLDDPRSDWIGIEAGGDTMHLSIVVWFPSRNWVVDVVEVLRGPAPVSRTKDNSAAAVGVAERDGRLRTRIVWSKAMPAANETYFIKWRAHEIDPPAVANGHD